jgi:prepilin-type N-terminal cleavage/methylation domain-containing protein
MRLTRRLQAEEGMTLVELLIAMTVMAIGIAAIVAGFGSGFVTINRARTTSTVGALADKQMETYRQAGFASLTPGALSGGTQTGSDGNTYWVGKTVSWTCVVGPANTTTSPAPPTCTGTPATRAVKLVSLEVHKASPPGSPPTSSGPLAFSESATFDSSTG